MTNKVVIRLINPKPSESEPAKAPEVVVVYHWRRIIAALAVGVLLVAGAVWMANRRDPGEMPQAHVEAPPPVAAIGTIQATENPTDKAPDRPAETPVTAPPASPQAAFFDPIRPLHRKMQRVQLTSKMIRDQPSDRLGSTISLNGRKPMRVFLFMETVGLKGKTLFHDWYWKGKQLQHARFKVLHDRFRAASSKFLNAQLTGPWQLRIVDENGTAFAEGNFEVR